MINLRPYQITAAERVNQLLNSARNPLLVMGAGTGKTKTAISIIMSRISLGKKILVLVPQDLIFNQWIAECSENGISYGYINDEGVRGRGKSVYICMYQSLSNLLNSLPEKFVRSFHEIITDEAHHGAATSFRNIYDHFSHCLRFGLTASPYRGDNQPLGEFYTDLLTPIKNSEAEDKGYLCKPVIIIPDEYKQHIPEDPESVKIEDQKIHLHPKKIIGDMIKVYKDIFDGLPVIVPCSSHEHAREVVTMYRGAGWKVDHIHGKTDGYERSRIIKRVESGETNILCSVGVGVEGMDVPGLYGIIWMRYTESLQIWIQFNGRTARPLPGKKYYVLVDPVGNSVIHGAPDIDRKWSLDTDYKPGQDTGDDTTMKICPVCGVMNSLENGKCWICRYDFLTGMIDGVVVDRKVRRLPKMVDGELVFLDEGMESEVLTGGEDGFKEENYNLPANVSVSGMRELRNSTTPNETENNGDKDHISHEQQELTRIEKVDILTKDLTGLKLKSKFREGVKGWL